ncbi:MAG TPA: GNAT family N-acetyltransferase [Anaerolineaceae bacterium]|nr:GNAT family N-acetyltransferase [Anaerolineaceae bacterium]
MTKKPIVVENWEFHPLTPESWGDFETLFGPNGACAGCWCAWFLMTHREFQKSGKEGHKELMRTLVHSGVEPGLIAYADGVPAGWVALAPRESYKRLATSVVMGPVDEQAVWVIPCFFIHRDYRRQGLMDKLLAAAVEYARGKDVEMLEAFPLEAEGKMSPIQLFTGKASVFRSLGFEQVAQRNDRPVFRKKP